MVPRTLRVLLAFGATVAALALTLATLSLTSLPAMMHANVAHLWPRRQVIILTLGAFAVALGMGFFFVVRRRQGGLDALDRLARLLSPLVLLPLLLALTQRGFGTDLEEAALLTIFVLASERLLRVSLTAWAERPRSVASSPGPWWQRALAATHRAATWYFARPRAVLATVVLLSLAQSLLMSLWAVWMHQRFSTYGYDTGQYDQLFATTLHGRWLAAPTQGHPENWGDLAGSHADFVIFPLLPVYALYPRASTLLVLQAFLVATAAVPLYLFARRWLAAHWAFVMAIAWLGYAPMHAGQLYGLHTQIFGAPFVMWAIFAVEHRRWVLYWLFFGLALSCREDVSMGLAALGTLLAVSGHRFKTGLATATLSTLYFFVIRFVVMPHSGFASLYGGLAAAGEGGFGAIILTLISNPVFGAKSLLTPEKTRFFLQMMAPLAFLPVRRAGLWVVLLPAAILTLFTTAYGPTISISFQYLYNWTPYAFSAAVVALSLLGTTTPDGPLRQRAAALTVLSATLVANLLWGAWSPHGNLMGGFGEAPLARPTEADVQRERDLAAIMARVPAEASLCTADRVQAHTTYHLNTWSLRDGLFDCEYLLWTDLPGDLGADRGPLALRSGQYVMELQQGGVFLARRERPTTTPPPPTPPPHPSPP